MAEKFVIKLSWVASFFPKNELEKGEAAFSRGHVTQMTYDITEKSCVLRGQVMASVKKREHAVELLIDLEDGIVDGSCSCPRREAICHHMAALAVYGCRHISLTDKARIQTEDEQVETLEDMYPPKKLQYRATTKNVEQAEVEKFKEALKPLSCGFNWLLSQEANSPQQTTMADISKGS